MVKRKAILELFSNDEKYIKIFRSMVEDCIAYECPRNRFVTIYPIEELDNIDKILVRKK